MANEPNKSVKNLKTQIRFVKDDTILLAFLRNAKKDQINTRDIINTYVEYRSKANINIADASLKYRMYTIEDDISFSKQEILNSKEFKEAIQILINLIRDALPPDMFREMIGVQYFTDIKPAFVDIPIISEITNLQKEFLRQIELPPIAAASHLVREEKGKKEKKKEKKSRMVRRGPSIIIDL